MKTRLNELPLVQKTRQLLQTALVVTAFLITVVIVITTASFMLHHVSAEAVTEIEYRDYLNIVLLVIAAFVIVAFFFITYKILPVIDNTLRKVNDCIVAIKAGKYQPGILEWEDPGIATLFANIDNMVAELEKRRRAQQVLIAGVAHELNTPLAVMRGHITGMADETLPWSAERLEILENEIGNMQLLVRDLLDLSQAETGNLRLTKTKFNISVLLQQIADFFHPVLLEKSQVFELELPREIPEIYADEQRIRQIVVNLLINASRYSGEGALINLRIACAEQEGRRIVSMDISDNGMGMNPDECAQVFDYFYRADSARNSVAGGRGIGLALVKQLVAAHGGHITVSSAPGVGTCFTIELPQ